MATIIRRDSMRPEVADSSAPTSFTFSDMGSQGEAYVEKVRAEAAKIVQQAKAEAAAIRQQAEADGRAAAESEIATRLEHQMGGKLETLRPALDEVVADLKQSHGVWLDHWRKAAVTLSTAIAERIVRRELASDPTISETWLTEALQLAAGSSELTVHLAPSDFENLQDHGQKLAESMSSLGTLRFVSDSQISAGGCVVMTRHGRVDQQLETQLERLIEELG